MDSQAMFIISSSGLSLESEMKKCLRLVVLVGFVGVIAAGCGGTTTKNKGKLNTAPGMEKKEDAMGASKTGKGDPNKAK